MSMKKQTPEVNLGVDCTIDVGTPAVFYCARCKKPYCVDCLGREIGRKRICIQCAGVEEVIEDEEQQRQRRLGFNLAENKGLLFGFLMAVGIVIIAINAYILITDHLESQSAEVVTTEVDPQLSAIAQCRSNLEVLAAEAAHYRQLSGESPASLDDLMRTLDASSITRDPVTQQLYIIDRDEAGHISAHCPTPAAHGLVDIVAVPGKPARLIYQQGARL